MRQPAKKTNFLTKKQNFELCLLVSKLEKGKYATKEDCVRHINNCLDFAVTWNNVRSAMKAADVKPEEVIRDLSKRAWGAAGHAQRLSRVEAFLRHTFGEEYTKFLNDEESDEA